MVVMSEDEEAHLKHDCLLFISGRDMEDHKRLLWVGSAKHGNSEGMYDTSNYPSQSTNSSTPSTVASINKSTSAVMSVGQAELLVAAHHQEGYPRPRMFKERWERGERNA